ncbi:MAG: iron ABC transporter permease [Gemmatimonadetes bacterium]|uniref:Iron ABC transporter permease n=1 Tax=Candidatus Kutchimonas denitrificans TaxID=3056748 RepID=A0AAE4Z575_9BACT|nr:iron ABC transporter permease [Gemmatimonadota bacterium]NIR74004.1 iron ABC transporter permease [Candidatus Kutchimonas denitrificans]NIS02993.1 iron ABC transporter permease [Gemmatimonadota bacterium]NIT68710.1 iron ABC transporter permease [Gemmatimonadota bacterium]NIU53291.1 iron chelate uptake ABC transporter family permease subunit [Gemmatimonadota bacterium]
MSARVALRLAILALAVLLALVASMGFGAADIPVPEVMRAIGGRGDETTRTIVMELRLPRALLAFLVGGALGLAGATLQALLRNPLAEPFLLGVSSGAAVGAVAAVVLGWSALAAWTLPVAAFLGALLATFLVLFVASRTGRGLDTRVLLLGGVVIGMFFNAVILLVLTFASAETFRSAIFWMMGSLAAADWGAAVLLTGYTVPAVAVLVLMARPLNALSVGEETALYLGVRVERVKLAAYILSSLLVAAAVAVSGVIGFVGLIIPHAIRLVWGSDHRMLLPASIFAGGGFLVIADTVARSAAGPSELPVGVITALVGVPLFVLLLIRRKA